MYICICILQCVNVHIMFYVSTYVHKLAHPMYYYILILVMRYVAVYVYS